MLRFNIEIIQAGHTFWKPDNIYTQWLTYNAQVFKSLELPPNAVLFNVKGRYYVEAMFNTGVPTYNFVPAEEQFMDLRRKGRTIAVFQPPGVQLPDYMTNDTMVVVIKKKFEGWE